MSFAVVTGASKGIGKAIALELAAKGYGLLLIARNEELLQKLKEEIEATHNVKVAFLAVDLSAPAAAQEVLDWCAQNNYPVSVLVNNAGYGLVGTFDAYPLEQHLNMLQLNCATLIQLTYLFLPQLKLQPRAHILNIGSSAAYQAVPYLSLYAATKALVLRFSRGLRYELRKTSVKVTCVCPGATDTQFNVRANVGPKAMKTAEKVMMKPEAVGQAAVDAMLAGKAEVVIGAVNKLANFAAWLLPQRVVEGTAGGLYE